MGSKPDPRVSNIYDMDLSSIQSQMTNLQLSTSCMLIFIMFAQAISSLPSTCWGQTAIYSSLLPPEPNLYISSFLPALVTRDASQSLRSPGLTWFASTSMHYSSDWLRFTALRKAKHFVPDRFIWVLTMSLSCKMFEVELNYTTGNRVTGGAYNY